MVLTASLLASSRMQIIIATRPDIGWGKSRFGFIQDSDYTLTSTSNVHKMMNALAFSRARLIYATSDCDLDIFFSLHDGLQSGLEIGGQRPGLNVIDVVSGFLHTTAKGLPS